ncbi:unnamed protein product [Staurois parvus]|uniref:Uncharacterized protein n=1 Tax=Staurois parvus TaxID=386267 RepID=A0ABN9FSY0_9NEOB|nr:unnamed protein product [Staurois parvus]
MTALTKGRALSVGIVPQDCIMASSPVRAAKDSLSAASAIREYTDAAAIRIVSCRESRGTVASTVASLSAFRWE